MKVILQAIKEFIHWRRVEAEISARRLLLTELERVDDEIDSIEDTIHKCRKSGDHSRADQLLLSQVRRAGFERGLLDIAKRSGIHGTARSNFGRSGDSKGEGSDNP